MSMKVLFGAKVADISNHSNLHAELQSPYDGSFHREKEVSDMGDSPLKHPEIKRRMTTQSESFLSSFGEDDEDSLDEVDLELAQEPISEDNRPESKTDEEVNLKRKPTSKESGAHNEFAFRALFSSLQRWLFLCVVGILVVSYWRGAWSLFDIYSCGQPADTSLLNGQIFCFSYDLHQPVRRDSGLICYAIGISLSAIGKLMFARHWWEPPEGGDDTKPQMSTIRLFIMRALMIEVMGLAFVCSWRGVWMLTEYWLHPDDLTKSNWLSACAGAAGCLLMCCGSSLQAPPTAILRDGPDPRPATPNTFITSLCASTGECPPEFTLIESISDHFISTVLLPFLECWFWRGVWTLLDFYLWGYSACTYQLHLSLLIGVLLFLVCVVANHFIDNIVGLVISKGEKKTHTYLILLTSRIQSLVLAVASVNFWRVVWYIWEEFLGGSNPYSAWISHLAGAAGLIALGCFASVTFPPSIDFLPKEAAVEEEEKQEKQPASKPDSYTETGVEIVWFAIARRQ